MGKQDKTTVLFAECKRTNEKVDLGVLETLIERSKLSKYKKTHLFLFSNSRFTIDCTEKAKEFGNVTLVKYAGIMEE